MNIHVHVDDVLPEERNIETSSSKRRKIADSLVNCSEPTKESNLLLSSNASRSTSLADSAGEDHELARQAKSSANVNVVCDVYTDKKLKEPRNSPKGDKTSVQASTVSQPIDKLGRDIGSKIDALHSLSESEAMKQNANQVGNEEDPSPQISSSSERGHSSCRKKLLVLDVNGLLVDIVADPSGGHKADTIIGSKAVFKRPYCDEFLQFCFERFNVGVWTSRMRRNIERVLDFLMSETQHQLQFCWDQSHCTKTGLNTIENSDKPLVLKELKRLWEKQDPNLPWDRGEYNESNTVLLDDSPYKALRNPPYTAIFPYTFSYWNIKDNFLGPGGNLRNYLERLAASENVQKFIEQNPFGQPPITGNNPHWEFYLKVISGTSSDVATSSAAKSLLNVNINPSLENVNNGLEKRADTCSVRGLVEQLNNSLESRAVGGGTNIKDSEQKDCLAGEGTEAGQESAKFQKEDNNMKLKVDKFGRTVREGASTGDFDDSHHTEWPGKRGRSWIRSRSPHDRRWSPWRQREKRSQSHSRSPERRSRRSRSPHRYRDGAGDDLSSRDRHPGVCYRFLQGTCFRGLQCRFSHDNNSDEPKKSSRSRSPHRHHGKAGGDRTSQDTRHPPVCYNFQQGRCFRGLSCRFSHASNNSDECKKRSRSRSPHKHDNVDGGDRTSQDTRHPPVCYNFQQGRCFRGLSCRFSHASNNSDECKKRSRSRSPHKHDDVDGGEQTTRDTRHPPVCNNFQQGRCFRGLSCRFSHASNNSDECKKRSRSRSPYKHDDVDGGEQTTRDTRHPPVCNNFQQGRCFRGLSCRFSHASNNSDECKKRSRSRSPRKHDDVDGGEQTTQDTRHPPVCNNFQQGRCFRGLSCHFSHISNNSDEPKKRSRSRSPHKHDDVDGGEQTTRDSRHPPVCNNFQQGRCFRGLSCRFSHASNNSDEPKKRSRSRSPRKHDDVDGGEQTTRDTRHPPVCNNFQQGRCFHGLSCRFSHASNNSDEPKKRSRSRSPHRHDGEDGNDNTRHPPVCNNFQQGRCFRGASCWFVHDPDSSDEPKKSSRSRSPHRHHNVDGGDHTRHRSVCNNFQQGRCFRGASCWFIHDPGSSDEPKKRSRSRSPHRHHNVDGGDHTRHRPVCNNFQQGRCFRGASCWFIHDPDSSDEPKKRSRSRSPRRHDGKAGCDLTGRDRSHPPLCYDFLQGRCLRGMSCRYLHDSDKCEEPKIVSNSSQWRNDGGDWTRQDTSDKPICYDFRRGKCFRGVSCRYIHDSNKSYESKLYENTERSKIPEKSADDGHVEVNGQDIQLCQDVPGTTDGVMKVGDKFQNEIVDFPGTIGQAVISEKDGQSLANEGGPAMSLGVTSQVQMTQDITQEFVEPVAAHVTDTDGKKLLDVGNMPDQISEANLSESSTANSDKQLCPRNGSSSDPSIAQTSSIPAHLSIGERQAPLPSQHSELSMPPASSCNPLLPSPAGRMQPFSDQNLPPGRLLVSLSESQPHLPQNSLQNPIADSSSTFEEPGKINSHSQLSVPPASSCNPLPPSPPPAAGRMQPFSDLNPPPCRPLDSSSESQPHLSQNSLQNPIADSSSTFEEPGKINSHSQLSVPPASSCNPLPPLPPPAAGRMQPFSDLNPPPCRPLDSSSESQPHLSQNSLQNPIADSSSTFEETGKTNSRSDSLDLRSGFRISSHLNPSPCTSDQPPSTKFNSVVLSPDKRSSNGNALTSENHIHIDGQNLSTPRSRNTNSSPLSHSLRNSNHGTKNKVTDNSDVLLPTNVSNQHLNLVENGNLHLLANVAIASKENELIE